MDEFFFCKLNNASVEMPRSTDGSANKYRNKGIGQVVDKYSRTPLFYGPFHFAPKQRSKMCMYCSSIYTTKI